MLTVHEFAEYLMLMAWLLLSGMIGKLSNMKAQLMQHQAHFVNSSCPPVV